jgi:putative resolvase
MPYVCTRDAKEKLQVSEQTLRRWGDQGFIKCIRTPGKQRLYDVDSYILNKQDIVHETIEEVQKICYCRVSSRGQKDDLERQVSYMQQQFPDHKVITDIGSGINFRRKGLRAILELASQGLISEVVVAYRDRLCRFAFELVEWILHLHGVKLVVLHQNMDASEQSELADDLLSIIQVFNCRLQGRRKYSHRKNTEKNSQESSQYDEESETTTDSRSGPDS